MKSIHILLFLHFHLLLRKQHIETVCVDFFEQAAKFVEEIKAGGIWNITNPASGHPLLQGNSEIKAPRLISFNQDQFSFNYINKNNPSLLSINYIPNFTAGITFFIAKATLLEKRH